MTEISPQSQRRPLTTFEKVGLSGLGLLVLGAIAVALNKQQPPPPVAAPPVAAPGPTETDEVVAFLQRSNALRDRAEDSCWQAVQCGAIDGTRYSVASVKEMRPCFGQRLPVCERMQAAIHKAEAPAAIRAWWSEILKLRVDAHLERAQLYVQLLEAHDWKINMRVKGDLQPTLEDWSLQTSSPVEPRLAALRDQHTPEPFEALRRWLEQHGVCNEGVACYFEKVASGAPMMVRPQYVRP